MKNSTDTIGNRTRDLLACSTVPQTTAPQLVHLAGFIIRIYRDARSPERQIYIWQETDIGISSNQNVFPIITTLYGITFTVLHIKICHIILLTILHNQALISVHVQIHSENKTGEV